MLFPTKTLTRLHRTRKMKEKIQTGDFMDYEDSACI